MPLEPFASFAPFARHPPDREKKKGCVSREGSEGSEEQSLRARIKALPPTLLFAFRVSHHASGTLRLLRPLRATSPWLEEEVASRAKEAKGAKNNSCESKSKPSPHASIRVQGFPPCLWNPSPPSPPSRDIP